MCVRSLLVTLLGIACTDGRLVGYFNLTVGEGNAGLYKDCKVGTKYCRGAIMKTIKTPMCTLDSSTEAKCEQDHPTTFFTSKSGYASTPASVWVSWWTDDPQHQSYTPAEAIAKWQSTSNAEWTTLLKANLLVDYPNGGTEDVSKVEVTGFSVEVKTPQPTPSPTSKPTAVPTPSPPTPLPTPKPETSACFPGFATVHVNHGFGQSATAMAQLRPGDNVLVSRNGELAFEPVLSFLHTVRNTMVDHMSVWHAHGKLHASRSHILFTAGGGKAVADLSPGDLLLVVEGGVFVASPVLAVKAAGGMDAYAPLTASGTIVVDGVVASAYASPEKVGIGHAVMHSFLFPIRAYHALGLGALTRSSYGSVDAAEVLHPFLQLTYKRLRVDSLLAALK